ncbi:hypothetical protein CH35J_011516 [Colletotrichum higginsianum]|uniref:Rhodopsin domain-containing protein n=1 Tax=Colletotrichum higginsianum TaxID=80884 RepID=A0A4T0VGL3_9PEZI|nr:hypothetical protein CH35J_011516 [Colletotrichum higginsianum]
MADDRVATIIGSTIGMICLTTLAISVRIMVRSNLRAYGLDDILITASWAFTIAMCTTTLVSAHSGFGKHHQDISIAAYERFLKLTIVTSATYSYGLALAKMRGRLRRKEYALIFPYFGGAVLPSTFART